MKRELFEKPFVTFHEDDPGHVQHHDPGVPETVSFFSRAFSIGKPIVTCNLLL